MCQENVSPAGSRNLTESYLDERSPHTASQPELTRSRDGPAASCSWGSDDSQEGMMTSTSQRAAEALNVYTNGTTSGVLSGQGLSKSRTIPLPGSTSPPHRKAAQRPPSNTQAAPHSNSVNASHKSSARESADFPILQDEDAKLAIDSLNTSQKLNRRSNSFNGDKDSDDEADNPNTSLIYPSPFQASSAEQALKPGDRQRSPEPLFDSSDRDFSATPWRQQSTETTPRAQKRELAHLEERSLFDSSPPNERSAPAPPSKVLPPPKAEMQKKVMTPAQFERYRKEQEMRRDQYFDHEVSDEEGDEYEDDDELERNKQLARERRKQEAHLSVYRQQMMKVTGEQPSDLPSVQPRARMDRSSISAPNLTNGSNTPTFSFDKPSEPSNGSDDEDEDIPLGVLAAHGFPTKNRPPTALSNAGSSIHYKSESYPPPPMSTVGASAGGASRGLPPFAKNLPPDPYYGAGLVNPSNRESLALGHGAPASVYGAPSPSISPGGLVGVIAGEERARAARRGSPNAQGNYSSPLPPGLAQMQMGMVPGVPPPMSPGEQATVQMSEQMNQMMQMQMQWMMQMQQMMASGVQGMPPGQQPPFALAPLQQQQVLKSPGMLAPPGNLQRPMSTGSHSAPGSPISPQQVQQRAMSMMGPTSAAGWQPQSGDRASVVPSLMSGALGSPSPGYTPSIAPSERSNVGMPSRYRPVSIAPVDEGAPRTGSRAFTFTSGMLQPGGSGRNSRVSASSDVQSKLSVRPVSQAAPQISQSSDDDDEEGWEEMKKKREERKNMRMKSSRNDHLGLDIYDYPQA